MREPAMINYSQGSSGLSNIRDLGGIAVSDGRHVKEGLLVRSEALCNASNDDLSRINRTFNLKVVIDFRTQDEYAIQPDPVDKLPTVRFIHVPIVNPASLGAPDDGKLDPQIIIRKLCEDPTAFMGRMYRDMVLQKRGREGYRTFFKTLLETDSGTVLWHCTEGKDRTGVASALLLHLLGATDLVIESDYLAVNSLLEPHREQTARFCQDMGLDEESVAAIAHASCAVDVSSLRTAFGAIKEAYGSVDSYLADALQITPDMQETLKRRYLN